MVTFFEEDCGIAVLVVVLQGYPAIIVELLRNRDITMIVCKVAFIAASTNRNMGIL